MVMAPASNRTMAQHASTTTRDATCSMLSDTASFYNQAQAFNRDGDMYTSLLYFVMMAMTIDQFLHFVAPLLHEDSCGHHQAREGELHVQLPPEDEDEETRHDHEVCATHMKLIADLESMCNNALGYVNSLQERVRKERSMIKSGGAAKDEEDDKGCELTLSSL